LELYTYVEDIIKIVVMWDIYFLILNSTTYYSLSLAIQKLDTILFWHFLVWIASCLEVLCVDECFEAEINWGLGG
jgi:hypothetical protein